MFLKNLVRCGDKLDDTFIHCSSCRTHSLWHCTLLYNEIEFVRARFAAASTKFDLIWYKEKRTVAQHTSGQCHRPGNPGLWLEMLCKQVGNRSCINFFTHDVLIAIENRRGVGSDRHPGQTPWHHVSSFRHPQAPPQGVSAVEGAGLKNHISGLFG